MVSEEDYKDIEVWVIETKEKESNTLNKIIKNIKKMPLLYKAFYSLLAILIIYYMHLYGGLSWTTLFWISGGITAIILFASSSNIGETEKEFPEEEIKAIGMKYLKTAQARGEIMDGTIRLDGLNIPIAIAGETHRVWMVGYTIRDEIKYRTLHMLWRHDARRLGIGSMGFEPLEKPYKGEARKIVPILVPAEKIAAMKKGFREGEEA